MLEQAVIDTGTLILGRVAERLLVDAFGGISLVLGWNLFRSGVVREQAATIEAMSWKVRLQKVGPGVFFALFGTIVLCSALAAPLRLDPAARGLSARESHDLDPATDAAKPGSAKKLAADSSTGPSVLYMDRGSPGADLTLAHAINSILAIKPDSVQASPSVRDNMERAERILTDERDSLVVRNLADRTLVPLYIQRQGLSSNALSAPEADKLRKVGPWMQGMSFEPEDGSSGQQ